MFVNSILAVLWIAGQAAAPAEAQARVPILAQGVDRCMTTYAVRLTRTEAADEAIFAEAIQGCRELSGQLNAAITREYPEQQARELVATLEAHARPNFMTLLQRIRVDRQRRAGN